MIDTLEFFEELKETLGQEAARKLANILGRVYRELSNTVTKAEFEKLTQVVSELAHYQKEVAEAQKKSEERLTRLEQAIAELTEAQKKTEQRLNELAEAQKKTEQRVNELAEAQKKTEQRVNELAEAQKKTEQRLNELAEAQKKTEQRVNELAEAQKKTEQRLNELAEAQKKTEQRLNELAEAQKKTEQRVNELAEAQRKTEEEIAKLTKSLEDTRKQVAGLSDTVGYTLENEAFKALPALLKRDYGVVVEGRLKRGYLKDVKGNHLEVNIIGKAQRDGKTITIVGESKVKLSKKAVDEFIERKLKKVAPLLEEVFPVVVTHMITQPDVEDYAKKKGIAIYFSYDF